MPRPHPIEFRRRAVQLARAGDQPIGEIAKDLGISESCLRNWMRRDQIETGDRAGLTADERAELVASRRRIRVLETENEILKRAAAFLAKENVLPK
jgi:transposase